MKLLITTILTLLTLSSFASEYKDLITATQKRAVLFFVNESHPVTGLTKDRAGNFKPDTYTVASTAATGYALCALPIGVKHGWITNDAAYAQALKTLKYITEKMPNVHGWYYHFVENSTGERVWNCELSTIDTGLLVMGALVSAQYWPNTEVSKIANQMYNSLDWQWVLHNDNTKPEKKTISMGWKPKEGWINSEWERYNELMVLYIPALGAKKGALTEENWQAWTRGTIDYGGLTTLEGGPIFLHQMAQMFFDFRNTRDSLGWDYWATAANGIKINQLFCKDQAKVRKTYAAGYWGLNANDAPDGYRAYNAPGEEDGTVSPTGVIASLSFTPKEVQTTVLKMRHDLGDKLWGRYGFSNSFNLDRNWYDPDVIGIDLGMAMLAIENDRTGMIWKLLGSHPDIKRGLRVAGIHKTRECPPRKLKL